MLLDLLDHFTNCQMASLSWRKIAHKRFQEIGLPTKREGAFQYLPLSRLGEERFFVADEEERAVSKEELQQYRIPQCAGRLVFVNGKLRLDLSDVGRLPIVVSSLEEALGQTAKRSPYAQVLSGRLTRQLKEETDPFALLNGSLFAQGLFLYVPASIKLTAPVHCLHLITKTSKNHLLTPRTQLFVGAGAEVNLISQTVGAGGHLIAEMIDVALEQRAKITHYQLAHETAESWLFQNLRATVSRSSSYDLLFYTEGAKTVRQECRFALVEEEAAVQIKGLSQLQQTRHGHFCALVEHRAPHTRSSQLYKQLLGGASRGSFEGKIFVDKRAQKTEAYQLCKSLILGEHAEANSKPNLEIFADDVKASHGSTVFQLDAQQLLYLKTRGLSEDEAKALLIEGFTHEILSLIPWV
jgi:Fe-S cluster assembly protein SufD